MTIDDQLRDLARHVDQHQQVITADEIVQRAASHGSGSFTTRSRFNDPPKVLSHMPVQSTEEDATMIDLETPSQTEEHRKGPKRALVAGLLAAAAVAAIAVVATRYGHDATPADQPSRTVPATLPPQALFGTQDEQYAPGVYFVDEVAGTPTPRIFVTLGEGWANAIDSWGIVDKPAIGSITFSRPERVWSDACRATDGFHPGSMTTLDGLVAALSEQRGWANVTAPTDIIVNGYPGKAFQRTAPASLASCNPGGDNSDPLRSWVNPNGSLSAYGHGEIERLRVLDVNGTIILINLRLAPDDDPAAAQVAAAVFDSIRIEQR